MDARNNLITYLLQVSAYWPFTKLLLSVAQGLLSPVQLSAFFVNFDFESVAEHPRFRESNGLLFLLRLFHEVQSGARVCEEWLTISSGPRRFSSAVLSV